MDFSLLSNLSRFDLEKVTSYLSLLSISALSKVSKDLRKAIQTDETIWQEQYQKVAANSSYYQKVVGTPVSWRLVFQMQKTKKTQLFHLASNKIKKEIKNPLFQNTTDNSRIEPKQIADDILLLNNDDLALIRQGRIAVVYSYPSVANKIKEIARGRDVTYFITESGDAFVISDFVQGYPQQILHRSKVVKMQVADQSGLFLEENGRVIAIGENPSFLFGPKLNEKVLAQRIPLGEPITWIKLSGSPANETFGAGYGTKDGGFYFGGRVKYEEKLVDLWLKFPKVSDSFVDFAVTSTLLFAQTTAGQLYFTYLTDPQTFAPFQLFSGISSVIEIQPNGSNLLVLTLSGLVYEISKNGILPLPLTGVQKLGKIDGYWITHNYPHLDEWTYSQIQPLIFSQEKYGTQTIVVDKMGNRYVY